MTQRTTGKLLIAEPMLGDPNFDRSVVLVLEHSGDGALGVVLNRPTEIEVAAVLDDWAGFAADPPVLYRGGPVGSNSVIALGRRSGTAELPGWSSVVGDVGAFDLNADPADLSGALSGVRFFVGYSGWGPGQLDAELDEHSWLVVDADPDDVFAIEAEGLWRTVLARQQGDVSMLANFPADPSAN